MPDAELVDAGAPVELFAALADESRWQILVALSRSPSSASALAAELPISRQAIAKHLRVLSDVGLVSAGKAGREVRYEPVGARLSQVARRLDAIARGWERRLDAIKSLAEGEDPS
ncbi:ArsR/SmtB family transcription factor [Gordonia rhizosphera]|uniref:Putative ArsR family transcriptional regulator n=1 Tax=Gordonia rhizosphera NBRC 16068 TaxID=1108045 RepID=K6WIB0_9ACTN|nr:metalloregulator ArsR/SmtB family transcription factor [Gordonia rhizosphera]GAB91882.1 putative ArsR family transcriptional regulator [Gordonia rhizosphera NBRC 16068]